MEITLAVRSSSGSVLHVIVSKGATVAELKRVIEARGGAAASRQRVIHRGRVLQDSQTLESYGIEDNQTVHLVVAPAPASSSGTRVGPQQPTAPPAGVPAAPPVSSTSAPAPAGPAAGLAPPPFFGFPSAGAGLPGMGGGMDVQGMQEQLMRNPELLEQVWSSPMMQQLLSNPDMLRGMIESSPQMRALLEANPSLGHILNDPAVMRQTMNAMRNPSAMREMMRSQDLAMSQLENHPEGFNALRRMYHEVQEPMMEATMGAHAPPSPSPASSAPSSTSASGAVPNPWAPRRSQAATPTAPTTGGLPGVGGLPGMGALGANPMGGNPFFQAMLADPVVQSMMTNPAFIDQMVQTNPLLRQMVEANPQLRSVLMNPDLVRTAMAMQSRMGGGEGLGGAVPPMGALGSPFPAGFAGAAPPTQSPAQPNQPALGGLDFSSLLGNTGIATAARVPSSSSPAPVAPAPAPSTAEQYSSQLRQLEQMGFSDQQRNLRALQESGGNVNAAVERLLR